MLWLFEYKSQAESSLYDIETVIERGETEDDAVENFLGNNDDHQDIDFVTQRFEFISNILDEIRRNFILKDYPYAVQLSELIDLARDETEEMPQQMPDWFWQRRLLKDKKFREAAKGLLRPDPETEEDGAPGEIYSLRSDGWFIRNVAHRRALSLLRKNDIKGLWAMYNEYCKDPYSTNFMVQLYGMAVALGIDLESINYSKKDELCEAIGSRLVVATKTGIQIHNLIPTLE